MGSAEQPGRAGIPMGITADRISTDLTPVPRGATRRGAAGPLRFSRLEGSPTGLTLADYEARCWAGAEGATRGLADLTATAPLTPEAHFDETILRAELLNSRLLFSQSPNHAPGVAP